MTGFESLLRWDHSERGVVSPIEFIPIAETGLIVEMPAGRRLEPSTALAEILGIQTVAEGIETTSVVGALQSVGCTWGQGYHFAMPLSPSEAEAFVLDSPQQRGSQAA